MTIAEMRSAIVAFCGEMGESCSDCPLRDMEYCWNDDECIEENYNIICEFKSKQEKVNHPAHYQGEHECIDVMRAMFGDEAVKGFCRCNAYKYRFRADAKNGEEDIRKAEWYEDYLIKMERENNDKN